MKIDSKAVARKIARKRILLLQLLLIVVAIADLAVLKPVLWPGGFGIGKDRSVSSESTESTTKDTKGNLLKTITTYKHNDGKSVWDWLSLLGVPASLTFLGIWFQQNQQKRAENVAEVQRKLAAEEKKEEALQAYFDRLSTLLIDKNLLSIATKVNSKYVEKIEPTQEELALLDSAVYMIRARTVSILQRFENDKERLTGVVQFLVDGNLAGKLKLSLDGADLSGITLNGANLSGANFSGANLSGADLENVTFSNTAYRPTRNTYVPTHFYESTKQTSIRAGDGKYYFANLSYANLSGVNLCGGWLHGVDLRFANLRFANLSSARLPEANLYESDLIGANLSGANLIEANFSYANLRGADLSRSNLMDANLSNANLQNANLNRANLAGANLYKANLSGADINNAYITTNTKNLSQAQIESTKNWTSVKHEAQSLNDPEIREKFGLDTKS